MKKSILLITALLVIWSVSITYSQEIKRIDLDKTTSFALKEQWSELNQFLDSIPENDPNAAVLRMLKGHACLAINENDVSFCCFLTVMKDSIGLQKWIAYATDLTGKNDKSSVSCYFLGDAQARLRKFDEAIQSFSKAIDLNKNSYLSNNARGVTYLVVTKYYEAKADFQKATEIKNDFADATNNLGNRTLVIMEGAKKGLEYFDKALEINPKNSLSYLGRGCLRVIQNDHDTTDFFLSLKNSFCTNPFFIINFDTIMDRITGVNNFLADIVDNPGTSFKASYQTPSTSNVDNLHNTYSDWKSNPTQANWNKVVYASNAVSSNELNHFSNSTLKADMYKNADLRDKARTQNDAVHDWNNGKAQGWTEFGRFAAKTIAATTAGVTAFFHPATTPLVTAGYHVTSAAADNVANNVNTMTNQSRNSSDILGNSFSHTKTTQGGVSQSFQSAFIENGKWPFIPCYGLLYNFYLLKK